jgi:predicted outer membrane repeat protein
MAKRFSLLIIPALLWGLSTTLTAQIHISGPQSGILIDTVYIVDGNISVQTGNRLFIEPGASFVFNGNYLFNIYGELQAIGAENDSIIFMPAPQVSSWYGIYFQQTSSDSSRLDYCVITGIRTTYWADIDISGIDLTISHCSIRNNFGTEESNSGVIQFGLGGRPTIRYSTISNNSCPGITCFSNPNIENCTIAGDSCINDWVGGGINCIGSSQPTIRNCIISGNYTERQGGGIYCTDSTTAIITDCYINENTAWHGGGGIYCESNSSPIIERCTIDGNTTGYAGFGAGIYCAGISHPTIRNCTITGNSIPYEGWGAGICSYYSRPIVENCTICQNSPGTQGRGGGIFCNGSVNTPTIINTIVANNHGGGVCFHSSSTASITYGDFHHNEIGNIIGEVPPGLGVIDTVNANGDPCDMYYNIFENPLFVDPASGDYHLMAESPCIDAGDPASPHDPDSTIADIGAFYYDQTVGVGPSSISETPQAFRLLQNYPNPFNAATAIHYNTPEPIQISLKVYNILGQCVATLFEGRQTAGHHVAIWNASDFPSGLYFAHLRMGDCTKSIKMVLLK